jgi:hypothetical protein
VIAFVQNHISEKPAQPAGQEAEAKREIQELRAALSRIAPE